MKPEKETQPKKAAIEIERGIENQKQEKSLPQIETELEDAKNELLLVFKKMIDQTVAKFDFQKNKDSEIESVTITRTLTGETLFHANNESWAGREDIKRVLGLMNSGRLN